MGKRLWYSPKTYRWHYAHVKMLQIIFHIREMQIKTIKYCYTWPKFRTLTTPNVSRGVEKEEFLFIVGWNAKWYLYFGRQSDSVLKTKHILIIQLTQRRWICVHTKTFTQMFIAALFIIAKNKLWLSIQCNATQQ